MLNGSNASKRAVQQNGRSFAKTIFWGKDFAKLRLMFFEIRRGFGIPPARRRVWGGMRAGFWF